MSRPGAEVQSATHVSFSHSGLCLPQVGTPQAQAGQALQEVSSPYPCCWTCASLLLAVNMYRLLLSLF